jgi:hypothetical protein
MGDRSKDVDASRFNDSVALTTSWKALNTGSSNFDSRKLVVSADRSRITYRTTAGAKIFSGLFIATGVFFLFVWHRQYGRWFPGSFAEALAPLACVFFIAMGSFILYDVSVPIKFNRRNSTLVKGRGKRRKTIYFSEIHALQLIQVRVSGSDGPAYRNHQLNIIFKDGTRMNIVTYYRPDRAREDANVISQYIGRPLWDAVRE